MAISFTRPDPSSPSSVASASFTTARKGFESSEVREFLRMVAAELARLQERERFLERELRTAQRSSTPTSVALDEELVTKMLGEEAARILHTARDAAAQIKVRSEEGAARLLREATDEAQRVREEAEIEAARRRTDATADAEAELEMAKQQGREMVNEARAYRERVLNELARRREIARQQIEQLVHGRDRLLQTFERSRLVVIDVMAELTPLGEPSEYVNLSPTTGPVPLMLPNMPRPESGRPSATPSTFGSSAREDVTDDTVALTVAPVVPLIDARSDASTVEEPPVDETPADETPAEESPVENGAVTIFVDDDFDDERAATASIEPGSADVAEPTDEQESSDGDEPIATSTDEIADASSMVTGSRSTRVRDTDQNVVQLGVTKQDHSDDVDTDPDRAPGTVVTLFGAGAPEVCVDASDELSYDPEIDGEIDEIHTEIDDGEIVAAVEQTDEMVTDEMVTDVDEIPVAEVPLDEAPMPDEFVDPDATTVLARTSADDLFARLRAARAESVAQRAVDRSTAAAGATSAEPVSAPEVAPSRPEADTPSELDRDNSVFAVTPDAPVAVVAHDDSPFARRDEALTPLITAAARKLKRVLADEQNEVLHALRRKEPVRELSDMLTSEVDQTERYGSAIAVELAAAAAAGAVSMGMDTAAAQREVKAVRATSSALTVLTDDVVLPLRQRLARLVADADGDNAELASLVRLSYREWKNQRIDEHLDDVTRMAYGRGALAGVTPGARICWLVDPSGPECPDAEDNSLGGVIAAGEAFPTDHLCAPAHSGCRCMIAPAD